MANTHSIRVYSVRVKYTAGAYVTNTVDGKRASSTMSASQAVTALGHRLCLDGPFGVRHVSGNVAGGHELWKIRAQVPREIRA